MAPIDAIRPEYVEFIPSALEEGVLYISSKYRTAVHLCCCGCKSKVVTPLKPFAWRLTAVRGAITLSPSIGSWNLPCKSHYLIVNSEVVWAVTYSDEDIRDARDTDALDRERHFQARRTSLWARIVAWVKGR